MTLPQAARRALGAMMACVFMSIAPSHASELGMNELDALGWKQRQPDGACNYMIVASNSNKLLYYGTSTQCKTRRNQHENAVLTARTYINAYHQATMDWARDKQNASNAAQNSHAQVVLGYFDAVLRDKENADVYGDACLAVKSTGVNYSYYYLDLSSSKTSAKDIETCVLNVFKGPCNKIGAGKPDAKWQDVKTALTKTCSASIR